MREFIAGHRNGARITAARELLDGTPAQVIPDWLESHDADLLVLGTIGTGAVSGQLIGDTAAHAVALVTRSQRSRNSM